MSEHNSAARRAVAAATLALAKVETSPADEAKTEALSAAPVRDSRRKLLSDLSIGLLLGVVAGWCLLTLLYFVLPLVVP